jgi:regulator of extracellular matrix RemA (YlzA/DUF370 family)
MAKFVKIGADVISIDSVSRISIVENQSGISDRIIINAGGSEVVIDSAIGGRARMDLIREKLLSVLDPEIWDNGVEAPPAIAKAA